MPSIEERVVVIYRDEHRSVDFAAECCRVSRERAIAILVDAGIMISWKYRKIAREYNEGHHRIAKVKAIIRYQRRKPRTHPSSNALRFEILARDAFRCRYCGRGPEDGAILAVDHIVPRSHGGSNEKANLITACRECNIGKKDRMLLTSRKQIPSFMSIRLCARQAPAAERVAS